MRGMRDDTGVGRAAMNWAQYLTFDTVMMGLFIVSLGILVWVVTVIVLWQFTCDVFRR